MSDIKDTRFIVVAGGVISGVGKGVATASIGKILKEHGYTVTIIKIDPYINYDAGTLRPTEHGEVWVTEDGGEIDQDLGTYERFLNLDIPKKNNITTGQVYKTVIDKERTGHYLGQTVQFIPHIIDEVIDRIKNAADGYDIALIEIGGTVGDYENVPFLFALKGLERELGQNFVAYILVTYLPVPNHIHEMKTKPTQQAIRLLGEQGILPDFIICRSEKTIDDVRKKKIEEFVHIASANIIAAPNVDSVYEIPLLFEKQELGKKLLTHFKLPSKKVPYWQDWDNLVHMISAENKNLVRIGIVGKYLEIGDYSLTDSYLSIYHALLHAGAQLEHSISIVWLNAQNFEKVDSDYSILDTLDGVIVPGGFGKEGVEGKINVISYVRTNKIPYFGICYGMQLAVVEFARNVCAMKNAHTQEVMENTPYPVVTLLDTQQEILEKKQMGGTMRLGAYLCHIKPNTLIHTLYKQANKLSINSANNSSWVTERHRHRFEINPIFVNEISRNGLIFSGYHQRQDGVKLMEFIEYADHPFFIATQAHPEFKSRFGAANALFFGLIKAAIAHKS